MDRDLTSRYVTRLYLSAEDDDQRVCVLVSMCVYLNTT